VGFDHISEGVEDFGTGDGIRPWLDMFEGKSEIRPRLDGVSPHRATFAGLRLEGVSPHRVISVRLNVLGLNGRRVRRARVGSSCADFV
jgi:hypothetical protein